MILEQLQASFYEDAHDKEARKFWSLDVVASHLSEAQQEAAIRGRLLYFDDEFGEVATTAGTASYRLDQRIFEIVHASWAPAGTTRFDRLYIASVEEMDSRCSDWRSERSHRPEYLIHMDTQVRLPGVQTRDGTLKLEGYRLPLKPLTQPTDKPEINVAHHRHLVNWALYRAFSKVDAECFDPNRAAIAYAAFERYFGLRPDSNLNKWTRTDLPHHNAAILP